MKILWLTLLCCCVVSDSEGSSSCKWHLTNQSFNSNHTEQSEYHLHCQLRTLQSLEWDTQVVSLSRAFLQRVVSLDVECSQVLLFDSFLKNTVFLQLPNLRELSVTSCKIREVNSSSLTVLSGLRSLVIRTQNQDWPSMQLSLDQDSFSQFRTLQHLDLSENAFGSVPPDLLCPLASLRTLNLSSSLMDDAFLLQFNWNCASHVEKLDLSVNRISRLLNGQVNRATSLSSLQLERNHISYLAEDAFQGLKFLSFFNCSSNRINDLPAGLFQDCPELRQIDLSNNSLTFLSSQLLSGLFRLVVLNISRNRLTSIQSDAFTDLVSLQVLRLDHNIISSFDETVFAPLHNLHILDLSHNRLTTLNNPLFVGLFVLSSLALAHNSIKLVERHSFQNCTGLRDLDLSGNLLESIPDAINDLQFLKRLDVSLNLIESLNPLTGMNHLEYLNVAGNAISRLTEASFSNIGASSLGEINMASNDIETIQPGAFNHCPSLRKLHLDNNNLVNINGLFHQLESLKWLNLSANQISLFDYSFLPVGLEWLDLHQNQIEELGNYFQINYHWGLRYVDASWNLIENIGSFSVPDSVELLYLQGNRMQSIAPGTFLSKANLTRVDLSWNQLSTLEAAALWINPAATSRDRPEFSLGANPWLCDCRLDWLPQLVQPSGPGRHQPRLVQVADVTCSSVLSRQQQQANTSAESTVPLVRVKADEFLCSYEAHCFALCHCCDFYACDCQMTCPSQCTCYHDTTWTSNIVDCSGRQQVMLPQGIPMDVTQLYLDGNDLRQLPSHALIGRKNLRSLFLNSSNIVTLRNRTFHGLGSLQILHLEDNLIEEIVGAELEPLENIRELYLQNNRLRFIDEATFIHLQWLQILRIDGNRLVSFPLWRLAANPHLQQLALSRNLWTCDCHFFGQLQVSRKLVSDLVSLQCQDSPTNLSHIFLDENLSQSCNELISIGRSDLSDYLPLVTTVSLIFVMVVTLLVLAVSYRGFLLYWCQPHRCWVPSCNKKVITGSSHVADVFLVYSLLDEPFVQQYLSPELERAKLPYRAFCLQQQQQQQRHWNNSKPELFGRSLKNSQRTLLVVSASFFTIDWVRSDVRQYLLTLKKNLTLILLIRDAVFDAKFQQLVKRSHVLVWGEDKFWDKIYSVIPVEAGHMIRYDEGTTPSQRNHVKSTSGNSQGPSNYHEEISVDKAGNNVCGHPETNHPSSTSQDYRYCVESNENSSSYSDVEHTYVSVDHLFGTQERYSRSNENPFYRSTPVAPVNDAGNITYYPSALLPHRPVVSRVNNPTPERVEIYNPFNNTVFV